MLFTSIIFIFYFLSILFIVYYVSNRKIRNVILLIASIVFYSYGEKQFVYILIVSVLFNYVFARFICNKNHKMTVLILSLVFNLGILFLFKYLNFSISIVNSIFGSEVIRQTHVRIPLGISFYTFQTT